MKKQVKKHRSLSVGLPVPGEPLSLLQRTLSRTDSLTLTFCLIVVFFGIVNVVFPRVFLLFPFYTSAGMSTAFQLLWVFLALLVLLRFVRTDREITYPRMIILVLSVVLVISFLLFRVRYPSLFEDGEIGGLPTDMQLGGKIGTHTRLVDLLTMKLFRLLPTWVDLDTPFVLLFRNFELNSAWTVVTVGFGVLSVMLLCAIVIRSRLISATERVWMWVLLACSCPMLNAFGFYDSYICVVFLLAMFFVGAWMIAAEPRSWKGYALSLAMFPLDFVSHEYLWATLPYLIGLGGLIILEKKRFRVSSWVLLLCGVVAGLAPLASTYALNRELLHMVYSYRLGLYLTTQTMACLLVSLPALLLIVGLLVKNPEITQRPSPIQGMSIVVLVSNVMVFGFPILAPSPPIMIHNYGVYGAAIYGCSVLFYLSTIKSQTGGTLGIASRVESPASLSAGESPLTQIGPRRREWNMRLLTCCAVLGAFTFVPSVYVHSTRICYERAVSIVPDDTTARWSRDMSPYVSLGLFTPVDTEEDRLARLALFRQGFMSPRPEWESFRALNMLYYIAWSFEFGKTEEGTRELVRVFGQPGIVRDLWMNGTRFTDRYENKAYRRIRDVSRRIIDENLKRQPTNDYLRQMSLLLDQYEKYNP